MWQTEKNNCYIRCAQTDYACTIKIIAMIFIASIPFVKVR